jgi:hypothetical protein
VIESCAGDRGCDAAKDSRGGRPDANCTGFLVGRKCFSKYGKAVGQDHRFSQTLQEAANDEWRETRR